MQGLEGSVPVQTDVVYPESGYAIFRDAWREGDDFQNAIHLIFKMGALSTYHFHDDVLTFCLYGLGERWIVDTGIYKYAYKDPLRKYVESRHGHNVVLVDDERATTKKEPIPSKYTGSRLTKEIAFCSAEYELEGKARHTRSILFLKPDTVLIKDVLKSLDGKKHRYKQIFHIDRKKAVRPAGNGFRVSSEHNPRNHLTLTLYSPFDSLYRVKGQKKPYYQGWASYEQGEIDEVETVGFERNAVDCEFWTELRFSGDIQPSPLAEELDFDSPRTWDFETLIRDIGGL